MNCQRVRDIKELQSPQTIEIRVLRKWISKSRKEELCYQFVDKYGDCIEATAEAKDVEYFDSIIRLQSCYMVSEFIVTGPRTYMATVDHSASLVIGRNARFEPATNLDIPSAYFNFASYDTIKTRIKDARLLTDYIGRVENNSLRNTSTGKRLRKTLIQDETRAQLEITLWPDKGHLIDDKVVPGHIVAITSTMVTEYNGRPQLESTYLTNVYINPNMPQTAEHVNRLRALPALQSTGREEQRATLKDLKVASEKNIQSSTNFTCEAKIKYIHENRDWYYVICSKCSNKVYPQRNNNGDIIYVCKDDKDITPNFRYCVNATIEDATGSANTVFFNESMQAIINISCEEMVMTHTQTSNPRNVPQLIRTIVDKPRLLHVTLKNDGQIVVNNVTDIPSTTDTETTTTVTGTSAFSPATPNPKLAASKRPIVETPGPTTAPNPKLSASKRPIVEAPGTGTVPDKKMKKS